LISFSREDSSSSLESLSEGLLFRKNSLFLRKKLSLQKKKSFSFSKEERRDLKLFLSLELSLGEKKGGSLSLLGERGRIEGSPSFF